MAIRIVTVSELKAKLASVVAQLGTEGVPVYLTQHGKHRAVLVSYEEYEAMLEKLDDLEDALAMQQALSRPQEEAVSLDEYDHQRSTRVRR